MMEMKIREMTNITFQFDEKNENRIFCNIFFGTLLVILFVISTFGYNQFCHQSWIPQDNSHDFFLGFVGSHRFH